MPERYNYISKEPNSLGIDLTNEAAKVGCRAQVRVEYKVVGRRITLFAFILCVAGWKELESINAQFAKNSLVLYSRDKRETTAVYSSIEESEDVGKGVDIYVTSTRIVPDLSLRCRKLIDDEIVIAKELVLAQKDRQLRLGAI